MGQATSGTRSIPTLWIPSRKESLRSRWSIVWRVRIWSALRARNKRFGASSEKTDESFMEQLSFLFNEAEVFSTAEKEEPEATDGAGHKRHKKHTYTLDTIPEGIPTKQVEHRLEGEDLVCPQ